MGVMKTRETAKEKKDFLSRRFSVFPRMQSIRKAAFRRPARGGHVLYKG